MGEVINFPGKEELAGMKMGQKMAKSVSQGKKVSQQQALGAMMETKSFIDGLTNTIQRVVQSQMAVEKAVSELDTHMGIMLKALQDNGVLSEALVIVPLIFFCAKVNCIRKIPRKKSKTLFFW